jgi:hypothetical protein
MAELKKMSSKSRAQWRCSSCKLEDPRSLRSRSPGEPVGPAAALFQSPTLVSGSPQLSTPSVTASPQDTQKILSEILNLRKDFKLVYKELQELRAHSKFMEDQNAALNAKIAQMDANVKNFDSLEGRIVELERDVMRLKRENIEREQYARINNIEISGIPESKDENLNNIFQKLSSKIEADVMPSGIVSIQRVATWSRDPKEKSPSKIIVKFSNRLIKNSFLMAARKRRNVLTSELGLSGNGKIYINHHLTRENKILYKEVRELARLKQYKFVWVKDCRIYVRKIEKAPPILIQASSDLRKLA